MTSMYSWNGKGRPVSDKSPLALTAGTVSFSDAALPEHHDREGHAHDAQVVEEALALHVLQVELDLVAHVVDAGVIGLVDLRPPRDARLDPLAHGVLGDGAAEVCEDGGPLRARADDVHVAAN